MCNYTATTGTIAGVDD
uniref:Uncharacterized protein n=1 Tax=Anguilla anguilla TaxID=7936 RepID=A0A0E9TZW6_ANGAN